MKKLPFPIKVPCCDCVCVFVCEYDVKTHRIMSMALNHISSYQIECEHKNCTLYKFNVNFLLKEQHQIKEGEHTQSAFKLIKCLCMHICSHLNTANAAHRILSNQIAIVVEYWGRYFALSIVAQLLLTIRW